MSMSPESAAEARRPSAKASTVSCAETTTAGIRKLAYPSLPARKGTEVS